MNTPGNTENLKRPLQPMPDVVQLALQDNKLVAAYENRPAYQRNDYLWWINHAVRAATKNKRLKQMLHELQTGNLYMGMAWKSR